MFNILFNLQELVSVGSAIFVASLVLIALIIIIYSIYTWNKEISEMYEDEHPEFDEELNNHTNYKTVPINPLVNDEDYDFHKLKIDSTVKNKTVHPATTIVSKYSGPKYSLISIPELNQFITNNASDPLLSNINNAIKAISSNNRKEFISPYSFFTELSDKELAKRINISVSALHNYFNNKCSKKTADTINEYLKENIDNFRI
jgi:hypothetical protein